MQRLCRGEVKCVIRAMTADSVGEGELRSPWEPQCWPSVTEEPELTAQ